MPVMSVGHVGVLVHERGVPMRMGVRLGRGRPTVVRVLMVLIVRVQVIVLEGLVHMQMRMPLA